MRDHRHRSVMLDHRKCHALVNRSNKLFSLTEHVTQIFFILEPKTKVYYISKCNNVQHIKSWIRNNKNKDDKLLISRIIYEI